MGKSELLTAAQVCGITGDEAPLTDSDVPDVVAGVYSPWEAAAVLSGRPRRDPQRGHGSSVLSSATDRQGIHVRLHTHPPRGGLITWMAAEQTIRDRATAGTAQTLIAAVNAYSAHMRKLWPQTPGQTGPARTEAERAEGHQLLTAMTTAWRQVMTGAAPEQLGLFTEVAG